MKRILKYFGMTMGILILVLIAIGLYIGANDIPTYEIEKIEFSAVATPEALERGKKLTTMLCANCHMNKSTGKLTGTKMLDAPPEFGEIYSQNITQDNNVGIGSWTDAELLYLLRTGIKKDGQYSPPYMAKLPVMADEDLNAIIAFLRSDDPLVNPDPTPDIPSKPSFLTKMLSRLEWKPLPMPDKSIPLPDSTNTVAVGKYLAHNLDCFSCHSADFKTNNFLQPELSEGYFAGGNKPLDFDGRVKLTANLTPDKETGIGNWSKEQFILAVKYGQIEGEQALSYPMMPYTQLTDKEAGAIYDYLQTLDPVKNKVERSVY